MQRVYGSDDFLLIGHLRRVLEDHHIACVVKNEHLIGGAGDLPPIECWPELWVKEDFQVEQARALVEGCITDLSASRQPWHCPGCGEPIEGQFSQCWQCGAEQPPGRPPTSGVAAGGEPE